MADVQLEPLEDRDRQPHPARPSHRPSKSSSRDDPLRVNSDFLTQKAPPRKSARLTSALLNYSRPTGLNLISLGSSWSLNLVARLHNGSRRAFSDLYNMVDSMQRRVQHLRSSDLKLFFQWWALFASYLQTCFDAQQQLLVPWLERKTHLPQPMLPERRDVVLATVSALVEAFDTVRSQLSRRPPDEAMAKIIKGLTDVAAIIEYFASVENSLPPVVDAVYTEKDVKAVEKKLAAFLHSHGDPQCRRLHLQLMCRAMSDDAIMAWQKMISPIVRLTYRAMSKKFIASHTDIVEKLVID